MLKRKSNLFNVKFLISFISIYFYLQTPILAEDWVRAYEFDNKSYSIDAESMIEDNDVRKFWGKTTYKDPKILKDSEKKYIMAKGYYIIDCNRNTFTISKMEYYDTDDDVVFSSEVTFPLQNKIPPGGFTDHFKVFVCSLK